MDNPILGLAILSLGAFVGVCVTALFYVTTVRPRLLEESTPVAPLTPRTVEILDQGGAGGIDELRIALDGLLHSVSNNQSISSQKLDEQLAHIKALSERLTQQERQFDSMANYLSRGLAHQDKSLGKINQHLEQQSDLLKNSYNILSNLNSSAGVAALAGRLNTVGEQVDSLATELMRQEILLRDIHGQTTPTATNDTLYAIIGQQAAQLNELAAKLSALDGLLGTVDAEGESGPRLVGLQREFENINQALAHLKMGVLQNISDRVADIDQDVEILKKQPKSKGRDRLTDIRGIGPTFAGLLNEAGIHDFRQLAALTPDELRNLVHVPQWRRIKAEDWIEQAKLRVSALDKPEESA